MLARILGALVRCLSDDSVLKARAILKEEGP